jgi:hypothetical protein
MHAVKLAFDGREIVDFRKCVPIVSCMWRKRDELSMIFHGGHTPSYFIQYTNIIQIYIYIHQTVVYIQYQGECTTSGSDILLAALIY